LTNYQHTRPARLRRKTPQVCAVCASCHNTACPVWSLVHDKRTLPLLPDIDCGALFRLLDMHGVRYEFMLVPVEVSQLATYQEEEAS